MRADFLRISLSMALFLSGWLGLRGQDMIITGVIDGPLPGGLPKAIELYVVNNIPDLSVYALGSPNNGVPGGNIEFTFPAVPATAGTFLYVATEQTGFNTFFGFNPDYTDNVASINGDDALELFLNNTVIDVFGVVGTVGAGQPWEYTNGWAYRSDGTGPSTTFSNGDWSYSGPNALNGAATNATATPPFPIGSYQPSLMLGISTGAPSQTTFCVTPVDAGAAFTVPFTVNNGSFNAGNTFTVEISDDGFTSSQAIGTIAGTGSGSITATIPAGTAAGTYTVRVSGDDPATDGSSALGPVEVIAAPAAVSGFNAFAGNGEVILSWANPGNCFDDVVILAQEGAAVNADFSQANLTGLADEFDLEPANPDWATRGNANDAHDQLLTLLGADDETYTVYNGNGNTVTLTGLTNGTTYHFRVFTEFGSQQWSVAADASATPSATANLPTVLRPGDMAIVGFDAQIDGPGGGRQDAISFVNFVPLNPGTEILMTDNGYETGAPAGVRTNLWNNDEGVIRLTWNGPGALPAGTVTEYRSGVAPAGWGLDCVSDGDGATCDPANIALSFNMSLDGDQVFIMQGVWNEGNYTCGGACQDATFNGSILYAFNEIAPGWVDIGTAPLAVNGNSRISRLPPEVRCFNAEFTTDLDRATYRLTTDPTPPPHVADQRVLLNAVKDLSNWKTTYEVTDGFTVQPGGFEAGLWYGSADDNWFDCNNWGNLQVPNDTTDVRLDPATSVEPIVVDENATFSDEFGDTAVCRDLFIGFEEVEVANLNDRLVVKGDLTIEDGHRLTLNGGPGNGGTLQIGGNWDNQNLTDGFDPGNVSTVIFGGTVPQTLTRDGGNLEEDFANVELTNPAGLTIQSPVNILSSFTFVEGILTTASGGATAANLNNPDLARLIFADGAGSSNASDVSHVDGVVEIQTNAGFTVPVGDGTLLHRATLGEIAIPTGVNAFRVEYFPANPLSAIGSATATGVDFVSDNEYWHINQLVGTDDRDVSLEITTTSGITDPTVAYVVRWNGGTWEQAGGNGNVAIAGSFIRSDVVADFSPFTFADDGTSLPVELLEFSAIPSENQVGLHWLTDREVNLSHYVVERSVDGQQFTAIGQQPGLGTNGAKRRYQLVDATPLPGRSYYRLRSVDLDGSTQLSPQVMVTRLAEAETQVLVMPQPVSSHTKVSWWQAQPGETRWELVDLQGRRLQRWGGQYAPGQASLTLDLSFLPAGVYHLRGQSGAQQWSQRIIK